MVVPELEEFEQSRRSVRKAFYEASLAECQAAGGPICNICGSTRFMDKRERIMIRCKACASFERTRVMAMHLERLPIDADTRILHFAPERGLARMLMAKTPHYRAADIDIQRYVSMPPGTVVEVDLCKDLTPIAGEYDLIIHSHVLEHVRCNFTAVLARLNALLSPTGRQLFQIPVMAGDYAEDFAPVASEEAALARRRIYGQNNHVRRFGRADLECTLGMLFDFQPYLDYDLEAQFGAEALVLHHVPRIFWHGTTMATVFDVAKTQFRI